MEVVKVGQFWKKSYGGIGLVLGVRDGKILSDYRQDDCDSRTYMTVVDVDEFLDGATLVVYRYELQGLIPSEFNDIADFYYGEEDEE